MLNKKGQQMTLGTIIAIALGIAVLAFLIFGFSTGWNNMWEKITQLGGGSANVDDVVRGCEVACAANNVNAYCTQLRAIKLADGQIIAGITPGNKYNCNYLAGKLPGLEKCSIECSGTGITDEQYQQAVSICDGVEGEYTLMITPSSDNKNRYSCYNDFTSVIYKNEEYSCCKPK